MLMRRPGAALVMLVDACWALQRQAEAEACLAQSFKYRMSSGRLLNTLLASLSRNACYAFRNARKLPNVHVGTYPRGNLPIDATMVGIT